MIDNILKLIFNISLYDIEYLSFNSNIIKNLFNLIKYDNTSTRCIEILYNICKNKNQDTQIYYDFEDEDDSYCEEE